MTTPSVHTTTLHTEQPPASITVSFEQASNRWYKALHDLHDLGIFRSLPDREFRVFRTLEHFRDDRTGHARVTVPMFINDTGYSERTVYYAINGLLANPNRLLAELGRDLYAVLPGWTFATRPQGHAEFCTPLQNSLQGRAGLLQGRAENPSPTKETRARIEFKNLDIDDDDMRVKLLTESKTAERFGGPFSLSDAMGLLRSTGADAETVRVAVRNADAYAASGKLRVWRGYVATQIKHGCTLFASIARQDDEHTRNRDLVRRLVEAAEKAGGVEDALAIRAWWDGLGRRGQLTVFDAGDRARYPDDRLWEILRSKARVVNKTKEIDCGQ